MIALRARTVALGAPIILAAVWAGGLWTAALVFCISALGMVEFRRLMPSRSALGLLYIPLLLGHLVALRLAPDGRPRAIGLLVLVWASDIAQYLAGRAFGRRRLAPALSPGKTVEGLAAGLLAACCVGWFGARAAALGSPVAGAALALVVATFGVSGDLFESRLKRHAGLKDSGSVLPGHGGVLDRFDSLLFAAPAAYWLLHLLGS